MCDKAWRTLLQAVWQRVLLADQDRHESAAATATSGASARASKGQKGSGAVDAGAPGEETVAAIALRLQEENQESDFQGCDADFEEI